MGDKKEKLPPDRDLRISSEYAIPGNTPRRPIRDDLRAIYDEVSEKGSAETYSPHHSVKELKELEKEIRANSVRLDPKKRDKYRESTKGVPYIGVRFEFSPRSTEDPPEDAWWYDASEEVHESMKLINYIYDKSKEIIEMNDGHSEYGITDEIHEETGWHDGWGTRKYSDFLRRANVIKEPTKEAALYDTTVIVALDKSYETLERILEQVTAKKYSSYFS